LGLQRGGRTLCRSRGLFPLKGGRLLEAKISNFLQRGANVLQKGEGVTTTVSHGKKEEWRSSLTREGGIVDLHFPWGEGGGKKGVFSHATRKKEAVRVAVAAYSTDGRREKEASSGKGKNDLGKKGYYSLLDFGGESETIFECKGRYTTSAEKTFKGGKDLRIGEGRTWSREGPILLRDERGGDLLNSVLIGPKKRADAQTTRGKKGGGKKERGARRGDLSGTSTNATQGGKERGLPLDYPNQERRGDGLCRRKLFGRRVLAKGRGKTLVTLAGIARKKKGRKPPDHLKKKDHSAVRDCRGGKKPPGPLRRTAGKGGGGGGGRGLTASGLGGTWRRPRRYTAPPKVAVPAPKRGGGGEADRPRR